MTHKKAWLDPIEHKKVLFSIELIVLKSVLQKFAQKDDRPKLRPKTTYKILRRKQI